jgi:hypothetical protein
MKNTIILAALLGAAAADLYACDLCGCYTPQVEAMPQTDMPHLGLYAAIAEQFTHFGTVQLDGREIPNPTDQHLDSAITQIVAGYNFTSRFALQISVPLIYRSFRRPEGFSIDEGSVGGLGDVSLLAKTVLFHHDSGALREFSVADGKNPVAIEHEPDFTVSVIALSGVKFPTGATARLKEEFNETEVPGAPVSGIHGHDLTLGTGSYDGIFGGQVSLRYKNFFAQADTQFTLRGEGAHQYRFANNLAWSGGAGYYLIRTRRTIVGCQCMVSGEHKDVDRFRDEPAEDTGITSVFLGPRVVVASGRISGEIAAEFPISIANTALQVVPDYRLRGGFAVSW